MRRLLATVRCDVMLQFRHGFYYATAFVLIFCVVVVSRIPSLDLNWLLPALLLGNLLLNTFYFIGGLTLLGLVENTVIVTLLVGLGFSLLPLAASLVLTAALYCLAGVIAVVRYHSINEYLMPSVLYTSLLLAPLLSYLPQWDTWLLYLHPLQATLLLAQAAFQPVARWQAIYGVVYSALWIGLLAHFSRRAFVRFIVAGAGGS
jgi:fluoroquinolone transport system permease protein